MKNPLSKQMTALLAVFALGGGVVTQTDLLDQFLNEKEGNRTTAYQDGKGIWTICRGITRIISPHRAYRDRDTLPAPGESAVRNNYYFSRDSLYRHQKPSVEFVYRHSPSHPAVTV